MQTQKDPNEAPDGEDRSPERPLNHHKDENGSDSDGSPTPGGGDKDKIEYVLVKSADVRKQVQCPICLGIIQKTRTVMECLHRFCRECIDRSMRTGKNECPACRTHCASRRSLRDDPNFDALIAILYPDIEKFEEEEFAFGEEEKALNKKFQASIAQVHQAQTSGRKRVRARATDTVAAVTRKSQRKRRNLGGQRNVQDTEPLGSYDEDINGGYNASVLSSGEDCGTEPKPKRSKRWAASRFSQPTSAATSENRVNIEKYSDVNGLSVGASLKPVSDTDGFSWGKGGMRSHSRHGNSVGGSAKNPDDSRISRLINSLQSSEENDDEVSSVVVISLSEQNINNLQRPYLSFSSAMPVGHLQQYVALHSSSHPEEIEMLVVESGLKSSCSGVEATSSSTMDIQLRVLKEEETLADLQPMRNFSRSHLLVGYQHRLVGVPGGNSTTQ